MSRAAEACHTIRNKYHYDIKQGGMDDSKCVFNVFYSQMSNNVEIYNDVELDGEKGHALRNDVSLLRNIGDSSLV